MSNLDLLTILEVNEATTQGWSLHHVYDLEASRWRIMVLGLPNAETAGQRVIAAARMGNPLAQKALSLVMNSNKG